MITKNPDTGGCREDLVKLREIAEKATQGSWMRSGVRAKIDGRDCHSILAGPKEEIIASVWYNTKTHEGFSDAVFVSAFSPRVCLSLIADRARMEKAIELLCEVYEAARDVSMAAVQDDDGEWSIKGDPELMLGRLYLATEEIRKVTKGASQ